MRNFIKKEIEKVVGQVNFDVFRSDPPAGGFGDYSSNVAMILKKNPQEIAKKIKSDIFEKVAVVGPGFLNFWLSEKGLEQGLKNTLTKPKKKTGKIQVEFISVNPTGEYHIGHGRGAFYGDVLANVLEATGYKVEREFFINDSKESNQIKELGKTALGKGQTYLTDNLKFKITHLAARQENLKLKTDDEGEAGYLLAKEIQKDNEKFIEKELGIKFDKWFSEERELRKKNFFEKTLDLLKKKKLVYEKDKALWLKTSKYGDDEDRVIVRSTREYTYFLSDIAYHINKFKRGYAKVIDIWGADHQGHVKRMLAVKKILGWKGDLDILISQMVAVKEEGVLKKLSKRKGVLIFLKDLIKEVGLDVARWFYLEKALSTQMEFDMTLAKEQSKKNPVYYVQYAGARMHSILKKSQFSISNFQSNPKFKNPNIQERNLILKLIQFPEIIEDITKDYQVQRLTTFVYELAKVFTDFYEKVPVLKAETEELKKSRLALVSFTRKILNQVLNLLGISVPEKM